MIMDVDGWMWILGFDLRIILTTLDIWWQFPLTIIVVVQAPSAACPCAHAWARQFNPPFIRAFITVLSRCRLGASIEALWRVNSRKDPGL